MSLSENQQIDTVEDDTDEDINQEEAENIETSSEDLPGSESDEESIQDQKEQEKILENVAEVKEIVDKFKDHFMVFTICSSIQVFKKNRT